MIPLAAASSGSGIGALGINLWAFVAQFVSFLIVLVLLWKYFLPIILRTLENRRSLIQEGIENAEKAKHDLAEATSRAEQIIAEASRQGQERIERATKNAEQQAHQIEEDARARAQKISEQGIARIQQEANRARLELSRDVVNLSIKAAGVVIERSVDSNDNRRLVQEFVTTSDNVRNN